MKRAIIVVGLGFGDEAKGATTDFLVRQYDARLVVRYSGGCQAGHNVRLPDGREHTFSQFGAGVFAGAMTYLGKHVIVNPTSLLLEWKHLRTVVDYIPTLFIHPSALIVTPYHQAINRLRESARVERHGTCGQGIGEARNYWLRYGNDAIEAIDLLNLGTLTDKLDLMRQRMLIEAQDLIKYARSDVAELDVFKCSAYEIYPQRRQSDSIVSHLTAANNKFTLSDKLPSYKTTVFEGAQGVLLDEWYGFHPYTTWSTVTPQHALEIMNEFSVDEYAVVGAIRAYMTRHGAGPFPAYDAKLTASIADNCNKPNPWQGSMRMGWMDLPLLRYAVKVTQPHCLAVSCIDQLPESLMVAESYPYWCAGHSASDDAWLMPTCPDLNARSECAKRLMGVKPKLMKVSRDELMSLMGNECRIAIRGSGPTHEDRVIDDLSFRKWEGL